MLKITKHSDVWRFYEAMRTIPNFFHDLEQLHKTAFFPNIMRQKVRYLKNRVPKPGDRWGVTKIAK